ncbi:MAG: response regulator [Acidimicrobiales bacterium]
MPTETLWRKVLIVDDSDGLRGLYRLALELDGRFQVVGEATDGAAAIDRARDLQPTFVMLDVQMPVMDGLTALPEILDAAPHSRVLLHSSEPFDDPQPEGSDRLVAMEKAVPTDEWVELMATVSERRGPSRADAPPAQLP